jgi:hypothetical protein
VGFGSTKFGLTSPECTIGVETVCSEWAPLSGLQSDFNHAIMHVTSRPCGILGYESIATSDALRDAGGSLIGKDATEKQQQRRRSRRKGVAYTSFSSCRTMKSWEKARSPRSDLLQASRRGLLLPLQAAIRLNTSYRVLHFTHLFAAWREMLSSFPWQDSRLCSALTIT